MVKKLQKDMIPIPCPKCNEPMHWCEDCQEYHCDNSDMIYTTGHVCENYVG